MSIYGNFNGAGYTANQQSGSGIAHQRTPFGHVTVTGKAGDVVIVPITALYPKFDVVFRGVMAQAVGTAAATILTTLADIDLALNPDQGSTIGLWVGSVTVAPGSLVAIGTLCTALKVTFSVGGGGVIYLAGA